MDAPTSSAHARLMCGFKSSRDAGLFHTSRCQGTNVQIVSKHKQNRGYIVLLMYTLPRSYKTHTVAQNRTGCTKSGRNKTSLWRLSYTVPQAETYTLAASVLPPGESV